MGQSFTRRARIAYYLAWLPMSVLIAVVLTLRGLSWESAALTSMGLSLPFALLCGSSYYMARALPLRRTRLFEVLLNLLLAALAASGLWIFLAFGLSQAIGGEFGLRLGAQLELLFGMGVAYFTLSLAFHYLILALEEIRRAERHADEALVLTREAELRALRSQLNPHFLFNSLNSIAALTTRRPEEARKMCQLLSDFLRLTLRRGDKEAFTLGDEIELGHTYLDIEKVRFRERMEVEEEIEPECLSLMAPPLLLQPLLENAVKHGVAGLVSGALIRLTVKKEGASVVVAVTNRFDLEAHTPTQGGRGLSIVRQRLRSYYGDGAALEIEVEEKNQLYRVVLRLPLPGENERQ